MSVCVWRRSLSDLWGGAHNQQCVFSQNTLETCSICSKAIMERILRATGKAYHPHCFTCVVCRRSLDGVPFTVDASNHIHCIEDFHRSVLKVVLLVSVFGSTR